VLQSGGDIGCRLLRRERTSQPDMMGRVKVMGVAKRQSFKRDGATKSDVRKFC